MFEGLKMLKQMRPRQQMKEMRQAQKELLTPEVRQQVAEAMPGMSQHLKDMAQVDKEYLEKNPHALAEGTERLLAMGKAEKVATSGIDASATITAVRQTPSSVNYQPVFELDLNVSPESGSPYPATAYQLVPLPPGRSVHVKVDPNDPSVVWVDLAGEPKAGAGGPAAAEATPLSGAVPVSGAELTPDQAARVQQALGALGISDTSGVQLMRTPGAAGGQPDPIEQLEKLAELRQSGALTDAEFEQQKQRILDEQ